ncbi:arsenite methyltransferase [Halocatena salina]|uniref:Arsenite methyltransferase n=1 Tax=Halocatena salina TaxID=2934340 RepID=A0A8U0A4N2_9EURY|nr:arsenite methyltransferase [Halocatena salina]UPM44181.1 arsenite methyltransferase [Halocatena salina]
MSDDSSSQNRSASRTDTALSAREQREAVRARYSAIAQTDGECGCEPQTGASATSSCEDGDVIASDAERLGYTTDDIETVASGADLGLGCGNPTALASLEAGHTVLDLGSGGGFDCFLAAREVGAEGHVIGVDMTPAMVERARKNVEKNDVANVEFRLGEIEHLPITDESVDVIISNCVINLSPDKPQVFTEAYRVLRPGGRLAISDVVMTAEIPEKVRTDPESVSGCVAGAASIGDLERMLTEVGFEELAIDPKDDSHEFIREWSADHDLEEYIVSATIEARKPSNDL